MIAPCLCRGTQKFVHRACLDRWRSTRTDTAFSQCTECHFNYVLASSPESENGGSGMRKLKYRFLVSRDFILIFLLVQLVICSIAFMIHGIDTNDCDNHSWAPFTDTHNEEHCDPGPGENGVCGPLRENLLPCFIGKHDRSSYYIFGMVVFFAIVGCIGCCVGLGQRGGCCDGVHAPYCGDCYWCIWCDCNSHNCDCPNCDSCGNCNCSGGDCSGDGAPILLVV